jgi:hypothetical protein
MLRQSRLVRFALPVPIVVWRLTREILIGERLVTGVRFVSQTAASLFGPVSIRNSVIRGGMAASSRNGWAHSLRKPGLSVYAFPAASASAASSVSQVFDGSLPPACAVSGRPPSAPPQDWATAFTQSPALRTLWFDFLGLVAAIATLPPSKSGKRTGISVLSNFAHVWSALNARSRQPRLIEVDHR